MTCFFDMTFVQTLYDPGIHFKNNKGPCKYVKIIGNIILLLNYARPDMVYDATRLS